MAARKRKQSRTQARDPQLELFAAAGAEGPPRVYLASQLERLAAVFGEELHAVRQHDFFTSAPAIWVPNRNVRRWLQMQLAREQGFAVHLNFQFLEEGLWSVLESLDPAGERPLRLDRTDLEYLVLTALREMGETDTASSDCYRELEPLRRYLGVRPDARRVFQLAVRLSGLFQDYEYHREQQVAAWLEQPAISDFATNQSVADEAKAGVEFGSDPGSMEQAQRALYRRVFGVGSERQGGLLCELDRFGERALSLAGYARSVLLERSPVKPQTRPRVHIFAMAQMSAFHLGLIDRLSAFIDFCVYLPAIPEHWRAATGAAPVSSVSISDRSPDDVSSWAHVVVPADVHPEAVSEGRAQSTGAARLNALWGRPAREMLGLLLHSGTPREFVWDARDLAGRAFDSRGGDSLLGRLQRELAYGDSSPFVSDQPGEANNRAADSGVPAADASVQIIGCPGLRREAETIYQSILLQMDRDPELQLTDIAILVPDMQLYRPVLQAVFEGDRTSDEGGDGRPRVPYNLSDFSSGDASVYAAGVGALLALADSKFSRRDLFALFLNPCFLAAHRLARDEALAWLSWADHLQINSDLSDRRSWHRALRRLRLGGILETPEREDDFRHFAEYVPFSDLSASDPEILDRFGNCYLDLSLSLRGIRRELNGAHGQAVGALGRLRELIERHLKPPEDRPGEAIVRGEMMHSVERLSRHLSRGPQAGGTAVLQSPGSDSPGYELLREILVGQLSGVPGNRGNYLAGGVTIAALQPIRPIPFRVLYLPGMGAGDFPGHPDQSVLNLRNIERQPGDATLPESNRALLLENLLSVRDRLYISYVNRDIQRDTRFHLCSPITELKGALETLAPDFAEAEVPLQMADERHLRFSLARAREADPPASDALASYARPERLFAMQKLLHADAARLNAAERAALTAAMQSAPAAVPAIPAEQVAAGDRDLRLSVLVDFLMDPLSTQLRGGLGLYDLRRGTEAVLDVDESFYWPPRQRSRFLGRALDLMLRDEAGVSLEQSGFRELIDDALRQDLLPPPGFAELEIAALQLQFRARVAQWQSFAAELVPLPFLRIGSGSASQRGTSGTLIRLPAYACGDWQLHADLRRLYLRSDSNSGGPVLVQAGLRYGRRAGPAQMLVGFLELVLLRALSDDEVFLAELERAMLAGPQAGDAKVDAAERWSLFREALAGPAFEAVVLAREEQRSVRLDTMTATAAREYLRLLSAEYAGFAFEDLPLSLLEDRRLSRRPYLEAESPVADARYGEELQALREDYDEDRFQMELVRLLPQQYSAETVRTVYRRLRPFFACFEKSNADPGGRT